MESLAAYIPTDRRYALAQGADLPDRTIGAALFADISGFTPLTEVLVQALGPQRGAEELTRWLNKIYDALVVEIENYRGSVISFSGDAITCWFDDQKDVSFAFSKSVAFRATAAALSIQQTMQQFAQVEIPGVGIVSLAIKVVVTVGSARRFLIGDPTIQLVDALAGETLYRLATAEHHTERGEILLDQRAVAVLGVTISVLEWREDSESGERFAVVKQLEVKIEPDPWPTLEVEALTDELIRPWLLPPVFERLMNGMGEFLTELRPTVSLFLRFSGIDYDGDPEAQSKLNTYIQAVQRILARYNSYLLQLTIGDKGSSFYVSFGAPLAHEDDAIRAVAAALELRDLQMDFITDVQIGISQGLTRTGACGGMYRRTYSAIGDGVNMAPRLFQNAPLGQGLGNQNVRKSTGDNFKWEEISPLKGKGKSQLVVVFRLISSQERQGIRLHEPKYALPMVGRVAELVLVKQKMDLALLGRGQIVGLTAEAGMGKSRLMAEIIRLAKVRNMLGLGGECQSYGTSTSYVGGQDIWRGFFQLDPAWSAAEQIEALEH